MGNFRLFAKLALGVGIAVAGTSCDKENKNEFKPYIPANKVTPELTFTSIFMGIILCVKFSRIKVRVYF